MAARQKSLNRWSWAEIDLSALKHNAQTIKARLEPRTKMMCVVKANAYGHGAVACAKALRLAGADQFAVATVEEGKELRAAGITQPILILSEPPLEAVEEVVEANLMPSVYTSDFALAFGEMSAARAASGRYHLAIDTGMTRIGIAPEDVVEFRSAIDFHRGLECAGTFTHFATADTPNSWDFELQLDHFIKAVGALRDAGFKPGLVHAANTAATYLFPKAHFDMVRAGIGLYGLRASNFEPKDLELEEVMSIRARVTRVVEASLGTGVSYGFDYRVPIQGTQIATIPIGYGDGLSRTLSGRMDVLVGGKRFKQVGRICMDQSMFAVESRNAQVEQGDLVTIVGRDGDDFISIEDMAELRGTIGYEVACDFGLRLEHIYV